MILGFFSFLFFLSSKWQWEKKSFLFELECLIFYLVQSSTIILPLMFYPLSMITIFFGGPYWQIKSFSINLFTTFCYEYMIATRMNLCLLLAFELIGPITSIPHIVTDHVDARLNRGAEGALILSLYTWHLWHFLT